MLHSYNVNKVSGTLLAEGDWKLGEVDSTVMRVCTGKAWMS